MKLLLFDLGGVLIKISTFNKLIEKSHVEYNLNELKTLWINSQNVRAFESGLINQNVFSKNIIEEFNLNYSESEFIEDFESWIIKPFDGIEEILLKLKEKYTLACLSNSNSIHWNILENKWNFFKYFKYSISSHKIGLLKPDKEIYKYILNNLPYEAKDIIFFDDTKDNIATAIDLGIKSYHINNYDELKKILIKLVEI